MADAPLTYALNRREDVHEVSGTGYVALGWEFSPNGLFVLRWLGTKPSVIIWPSKDMAMDVHGHDGKTTSVPLGPEMSSLPAYLESTLAVTEAFTALSSSLTAVRAQHALAGGVQ